jgi:hypothetical protein
LASKKSSTTIETRLGLLILLVLITIGAGVFYRQFDFNPAVTVMQVRDSKPNGPADKTAKNLLPLPDGFVPMTPPELFKPNTLFEKINGQADLYLSSGFLRLDTQRFMHRQKNESWLELFIYHMGSHLNAFSVYSQQYRENAKPLTLARFGYQIQSAVFMVHGPYYLEIIPSEASEELNRAARSLADRFIKSRPLDKKEVQGFGWFPVEELDKNSLRMIMANAFGFDRLDKVFTAEYGPGDNKTTAFVSLRRDALEAEELVRSFSEFLIAFEGKPLDTDLPIKGVKVIEIMDTFEIIFSQGPYLAGIHEAADRESARKLAIRLHQRIKEVAHD